jgi:hypothetical protein
MDNKRAPSVPLDIKREFPFIMLSIIIGRNYCVSFQRWHRTQRGGTKKKGKRLYSRLATEAGYSAHRYNITMIVFFSTWRAATGTFEGGAAYVSIQQYQMA